MSQATLYTTSHSQNLAFGPHSDESSIEAISKALASSSKISLSSRSSLQIQSLKLGRQDPPPPPKPLSSAAAKSWIEPPRLPPHLRSFHHPRHVFYVRNTTRYYIDLLVQFSRTLEKSRGLGSAAAIGEGDASVLEDYRGEMGNLIAKVETWTEGLGKELSEVEEALSKASTTGSAFVWVPDGR
ncbi:MAG: hypothetical protein Q9202_002013 [Teloschistes flavicans]